MHSEKRRTNKDNAVNRTEKDGHFLKRVTGKRRKTRENSTVFSKRNAKGGYLLCASCFIHKILLDSHNQTYFIGAQILENSEVTCQSWKAKKNRIPCLVGSEDDALKENVFV